MTTAKGTEAEWVTVHEESAARVLFDTPGDQFIGVYQGEETITPDGEKESFTMFRFTGEDGQPYAVNQSYTLKEGMTDVKIGEKCRLTYVKDIPTGRGLNPLKDFRIDVAR